jgi:hypothetical protein
MSVVADGHEQIDAGLALIVWSGLAARDPCNGLLTAPHDEEFEMLAKERHEQYGRVLSWAVFAIGCEYILKEACLVRGLRKTKYKEVLRPPRWDEDLGQWSCAVLRRDSSVCVTATNSGTLAELPLKKLLANVPQQEQHQAAFELLRDSMRNRDAHQYVPNVRAAHFQAVPRLFIPALNAVIQSLGSSHC